MATPNRATEQMDREIHRRHLRKESQRAIASALGCSHRMVGRRLEAIRSEGRFSQRQEPVPEKSSLDSALEELRDWFGSPEEEAYRNRPRRGDLYDCEADSRMGSEGFLEGEELS